MFNRKNDDNLWDFRTWEGLSDHQAYFNHDGETAQNVDPQPLVVFLATNHLRIQNRMQDTLGCFSLLGVLFHPNISGLALAKWYFENWLLGLLLCSCWWYPNGVDNHWSGAPKPTDIAYLFGQIWGGPTKMNRWHNIDIHKNPRLSDLETKVLEDGKAAEQARRCPWRCLHLVQFDSSNECHPVKLGMIMDVSLPLLLFPAVSEGIWELHQVLHPRQTRPRLRYPGRREDCGGAPRRSSRKKSTMQIAGCIKIELE